MYRDRDTGSTTQWNKSVVMTKIDVRSANCGHLVLMLSCRDWNSQLINTRNWVSNFIKHSLHQRHPTNSNALSFGIKQGYSRARILGGNRNEYFFNWVVHRDGVFGGQWSFASTGRRSTSPGANWSRALQTVGHNSSEFSYFFAAAERVNVAYKKKVQNRTTRVIILIVQMIMMNVKLYVLIHELGWKSLVERRAQFVARPIQVHFEPRASVCQIKIGCSYFIYYM